MAESKPHVLFIAVDDLRPDIGCYGHADVQTPNIDRLASDGVVFERAYCQQAVCTFSRFSLMTGRYPGPRFSDFRKKDPAVIARARDGLVSLTEQFQRHGYKTVGIGKLFDKRMTIPTGDVWQTFHAGAGNGFVSASMAERFRAAAEDKSLQKFRPAFERADTPDDTYPDGKKAAIAIAEIESHDAATPLFLGVGFFKPHLPFVAPEKYWALYDGDALPLANRRTPPADCTDLLFCEYKEIDSYAHPDPMTESFERELRHGYLACVSYIDAQIGRVIAALKEKGIYDDTLVVLWGDHGFKLGDFGEWAKHTNLETDVRVPLIFKLPGGAHVGRKTDALAELVDILPTLCEAAGLPIPTSAQGRSLLPVIEDKASTVRAAAFSRYPKPEGQIGYSIRTDRWRYHEVRPKRAGAVTSRELYDLSTDLTEQRNVIDDYPDVADEHADLLAARLRDMRTNARPQ
ncbi:MAG: sulfatase [Planctomycetota bacterium]